jgi:hypothetical protein
MAIGTKTFYENEIPQWARNKGAYTISFVAVLSELDNAIDIEIFGLENEQTKIITNSFTSKEKEQLLRELMT